MNIFWFRRDLRIEDNVGLFHAFNSNEEVLPIFIFDEIILSELPKDDARVSFIHEQLEKIQSELNKIGKSLANMHIVNNPTLKNKNLDSYAKELNLSHDPKFLENLNILNFGFK